MVRARKYFTHAQTVYTRPSPFFLEGPGYEASIFAARLCEVNTPSRPSLVCTCIYIYMRLCSLYVQTVKYKFLYIVYKCTWSRYKRMKNAKSVDLLHT